VGDRIQAAYRDMGILDNTKTDLAALTRQDEQIAEEIDRQRYESELAVRKRAPARLRAARKRNHGQPFTRR